MSFLMWTLLGISHVCNFSALYICNSVPLVSQHHRAGMLLLGFKAGCTELVYSLDKKQITY